MLATTLGYLVLIASLFSQGAASPAGLRPSFEVASVKPYVTPPPGQPQPRGIRATPGGRLNISGMTLKAILAFAYRVRDFQILGGPDWIDVDQWEVAAKAEDGAIPRQIGPPDPNAPNPLTLMTQSLIDERFHLKMHRETRELPTYELVVAKDGARFKLSEDQGFPQPPDPKNPAPPPPPPPPPGQRGAPGRGGLSLMRTPAGFVLQGNAIPIANLVNLLGQELGRTVIDKTELKPGLYDFKLQWTPDPGLGTGGLALPPPNGGEAPPPVDPAGPSIFSAIQEQLGLRLVSSKGPVEVFVIESVQKPPE